MDYYVPRLTTDLSNRNVRDEWDFLSSKESSPRFEIEKNHPKTGSNDVAASFSFQSACNNFLTRHPKRNIYISWNDGKTWTYIQCGQLRTNGEVLIFLPGLYGSAAAFFLVLEMMEARGRCCISIDPPDVSNSSDFLSQFENFITALGIEQYHLITADMMIVLAMQISYLRTKLRSLVYILGAEPVCTSNYIGVRRRVIAALALSLPFSRLLPSTYFNKSHIDGIIDPLFTMPQKLKDRNAEEFISYLINSECSKNHRKRLGLYVVLDDGKQCNTEVPTTALIPERMMEAVQNDATLNAFLGKSKIAYIKSESRFPYLADAEEICLFLNVHLRHMENKL